MTTLLGFSEVGDFQSLTPTEVQTLLNFFSAPGGTVDQYVRGDGSLATLPPPGATWGTNLSNIPENITAWANINPSSKFDTPDGSVYQYVAGDGTLQWIPGVPEPVWGEIGGAIEDQTDLSAALNDKVSVGGSFADAYTQSASSASSGYNVNNQVEGQRILANTAQHLGLPSTLPGTQIYLVECHLVNDTGTTKNVYQIARNIAPSGDGYGTVFVRTGAISAFGTTWNDWTQLGGSGGGAGTVTSVGLSAPTGFNVSNSPVTDAGDIALTYASGYQGYTTTEANKLAGIAAGAQVNVPTNLSIGTRTSTAVPIVSSTGSNASFPAATTTLAGALSAADKSKLNGIAANATVGAAWGSNLTGIPANISSWANISPGSKFDTPSGTTAQYIRGNGTLATFPSIPAGTVTSVSGGNGLSGSVTSSGSISLGTPGTLSGSTTNAVQTSSHTHALSTNLSAWDGVTVASKADSARTITAGNGLSGGGNLTANRTITLGTPGTITNSTTNSVSSTGHTHALTVTKADVGLSNARNEDFTDYGLGGGGLIADGSYDGHFGTTTTQGLFFHHSTSGAPSDSPTGGQTAGIHIGTPWGRAQIAMPNAGTQMFFRTGTNTGWNEVWHSGNGATTSSTSTYFYLRGDNSNYGLTLVRSGTQAFLDASSLVRLSVGSTQLDLMSSGVRAAAAGASQQLLVERTNNTINSAIEYKGSSGASVYAGMGDTGLFGIGANSDIRYSHSSTWAEFGPSGLRTKSSVIVANGVGIVEAGSLRSSSGAADIASVNAGGVRLMPNGWSTSNHTNIAANGNMTVRGTVSATNLSASSDPRLKDDIKKVKARRELIEKLEYFSFKWKKDGVAGRSIMADKVQEIAPEHVHIGEEDGMLSVDKGGLALEMVLALLDKLKEEENGPTN